MSIRDIRSHEDHHCNEIRRVSLEKTPTPTVDLCPGRFGFDIDVKLPYYVDEAGVVQYFQVGPEPKESRQIGIIDASGGAVPLVALDLDNDGSNVINAGDWFVVKGPGLLAPAPAFGEAEVEAGDLVYALVDNPASNADFYTIQRNLRDLTGLVVYECPNIAFAETAPGSGEYVADYASALISDIVGYSLRDDNGEVHVFAKWDAGSITLVANVPIATPRLCIWGAAA